MMEICKLLKRVEWHTVWQSTGIGIGLSDQEDFSQLFVFSILNKKYSDF